MNYELVYGIMLVIYCAFIIGAVVHSYHRPKDTTDWKLIQDTAREMRLLQLQRKMAASGWISVNGYGGPKVSLRVLARFMGYSTPRSARTHALAKGTLRSIGFSTHLCPNRKLVTIHHNGNGHQNRVNHRQVLAA